MPRPNQEELTPQERALRTIRAARDSVWVVTDSLEKLAANNNVMTDELRGNIERNVGHLDLVVASPDVQNAGEDISDLHNAITSGKAALTAAGE